MLAVALAITLIAALACGAADEAAEPDAPKDAAAAATAVPGTDTPAVKVADPKAAATAVSAKAASPAEAAKIAVEEATRAPVVAAREAPMKEAEAGFKYVAVPQVPGIYWDYKYTGPKPTEFGESPKFAELVKQGKLPSVEERLPDEVKVVQPPHGIGTYGGIRRVTTTGGPSGGWQQWDKKNSNEWEHLPHVGFYSISDDGRVYTYRLRPGVKWSDGVEMTMEDVRFAWEDVNFNKELHETPQTQWLDAVTGNIIKFAVVDDLHWTLTWDTPDFILMEGEVRPGQRCTAFSFCFFAPSDYMKQFHPDYADPAKLDQMIAEEEVADWVRLWGLKNSFSTNIGWPRMGHFILETESDTLWTMSANPYFFEVDPEGNQLPYNDGVQVIRVESREVAVFRSMAGETDFGGPDFLVQEIPLYRTNMEKGDFSIKIWPTTGPGDIAMSICQTCNQDAELGRLMRTKDFRIALSHAVDREAMNDTLYLGLGIPNNWVPHPTVPYYPGDDHAFKDIDFDPDKADAMLDALGYTAKDSEGFRLRTDGSGDRLSFRTLSELGQTGDAAVLQIDYWADVGIEFKDKNMNSPWTLSYPGKEPLAIMRHFSLYGANPWFSSWTRCCGTGGGPAFTPDISDLDRSMKRGLDGAVEVEGGYKARCDCEMSSVWEPQAPADTYPADPSGNIAWMSDNWHKGRAVAAHSPERIEIGKQIFRIHADEKFYLSVVSHMGYMRGIVLNRNNMRNVPDTQTSDTWGWYNELFYFTDGKDNIGN